MIGGLEWGVYERGALGFVVERYHGSAGIAAIAITRGLAEDFARVMNRDLEGIRAAMRASGIRIEPPRRGRHVR